VSIATLLECSSLGGVVVEGAESTRELDVVTISTSDPAAAGVTVATLRHELWDEVEGRRTFCLAGPMGGGARALLSPDAQLVWEVEVGRRFEAMTAYYEHMNRGEYAHVIVTEGQSHRLTEAVDGRGVKPLVPIS